MRSKVFSRGRNRHSLDVGAKIFSRIFYDYFYDIHDSVNMISTANIVNSQILRKFFLWIDKHSIYLNHYPFLCFSGSYKPDVWQLFGHVHTRKNNTGIDADRLQYLYPTQYDVGVDNNNFTPVSYNQVRKIIEKQIHDSKQLRR